MNNIYTEAFSENSVSQQYEYKQKYTSKRKRVSKDTSKETYDKARDKASRVYREVRVSKREWRDE